MTYYSNFQRAFAWYVDHDPEWLIENLDRLDEFWSNQGLVAEGRTCLYRLCNRTLPEQPAHALVLLRLGKYAQQQQDFDEAERLLLQARTIFERQRDSRNLAVTDELIGWTLYDQPVRQPEAHSWFVSSYNLWQAEGDARHQPRLLWAQGASWVWNDLDEAERLFQAALISARTQQDKSIQKAVQLSLITVAHERGDIEMLAYRYASVKTWATAGGHSAGQAWALFALTEAAIALDRLDEAEDYCRQAKEAFRALRISGGMIKCDYFMATLHLRRGELALADRAYRACVNQARSLAEDSVLAAGMLRLAEIAQARAESRAAVTLLAATQALADRAPAIIWPQNRACLQAQIAKIQAALEPMTFGQYWRMGYEADLDLILAGFVPTDQSSAHGASVAQCGASKFKQPNAFNA